MFLSGDPVPRDDIAAESQNSQSKSQQDHVIPRQTPAGRCRLKEKPDIPPY